MNIGQRMKQRRKELNISAEELGRRLGKDRSTIYRYEKGDIENLPLEILEPIAYILQTTPQFLMGWENETDGLQSPSIATETITFPVIGEIAAGYDSIAVEDWSGETVEIPISYLKGRRQEEFFVLSVKGNSMYPQYQNGDKVLVLKQSFVERSGDVAAIMYENDLATLKKVEFVDGEDWLRLVPINPEYAPKTIEGAELEQCRVIGVPRLLIRDIEM